MDTNTSVSFGWIVSALTVGRPGEKLEAQSLLSDSAVTIDRDSCRHQLLHLLNGDYRPDPDPSVDADLSGIRCWLLSTLGRLPAEGEEPESTLRRHLDHRHEPNYWCRYWALEGLLRERPEDLAKLCESLLSSEPDVLPRMLACAVLADSGRGKQTEQIKAILADTSGSKDAIAMKWGVLRALRHVYLPFAYNHIKVFVEHPGYDDITYDAIVALGNIPLEHRRQAEEAGLALTKFIVEHRQWLYWDAMRIRAIESLGGLRVESTASLLLEELADYNPAVSQAAASSLERILGPQTTVARVLEALVRQGDHELPRFARGLREMRGQKAIADELYAAIVSRGGEAGQYAQRLLGEIGGPPAFEKLRSLTKSTETYITALNANDEKLSRLFGETIDEARTGFKVVIGMDVVIFAVGIVLIFVSASLALRSGGTGDAWSAWITGAGGVLSVLYSRFIARPRSQVETSVRYLSALKAVFLGYVRQLHQSDQAFIRRVLEADKLTAEETKGFNDLVEEVMDKCVRLLGSKTLAGSSARPPSESEPKPGGGA